MTLIRVTDKYRIYWIKRRPGVERFDMTPHPVFWCR